MKFVSTVIRTQLLQTPYTRKPLTKTLANNNRKNNQNQRTDGLHTIAAIAGFSKTLAAQFLLKIGVGRHAIISIVFFKLDKPTVPGNPRLSTIHQRLDSLSAKSTWLRTLNECGGVTGIYFGALGRRVGGAVVTLDAVG